jgi:hypothetical protein
MNYLYQETAAILEKHRMVPSMSRPANAATEPGSRQTETVSEGIWRGLARRHLRRLQRGGSRKRHYSRWMLVSFEKEVRGGREIGAGDCEVEHIVRIRFVANVHPQACRMRLATTQHRQNGVISRHHMPRFSKLPSARRPLAPTQCKSSPQWY